MLSEQIKTSQGKHEKQKSRKKFYEFEDGKGKKIFCAPNNKIRQRQHSFVLHEKSRIIYSSKRKYR